MRHVSHAAALHLGQRTDFTEELRQEPESDQNDGRNEGYTREPTEEQNGANAVTRVGNDESAQPACMNMALRMVIQLRPAIMSAGTSDQRSMKALPPASSSMKTSALVPISKVVMIGNRRGRREASPRGIMNFPYCEAIIAASFPAKSIIAWISISEAAWLPNPFKYNRVVRLPRLDASVWS